MGISDIPENHHQVFLNSKQIHNVIMTFFRLLYLREKESLGYHKINDFVFKIRLIRLGFSYWKQKFLYLNSQPTDSQSGVITTTPQSQLWVGDTEKLPVTFSHAWIIPVEFT